jgi:hypothetical protein
MIRENDILTLVPERGIKRLEHPRIRTKDKNVRLEKDHSVMVAQPLYLTLALSHDSGEREMSQISVSDFG